MTGTGLGLLLVLLVWGAFALRYFNGRGAR